MAAGVVVAAIATTRREEAEAAVVASPQLSASQPAAVGRVGVVGEHDAQHGGVGLSRPVGQAAAPAAEVLATEVAIFPETRSRDRNRSIVNELVRLHRQYLDGRLPVYDGRKNIYTAGALPFKNKEFVVKLANATRGHQREEEYKMTIQHASKLDLYNLQQFLAGRHRELPQDTIQALDIALRESPAAEYLSISRSFFSQSFGHGGPIGNGVECWRGYYQSLRPTQMGLSLNIDISATSFYKAQPVMAFAVEYLNPRDTSRLSDQDRLKIVNRNNYGNDCYSKEFGMKVTNQLALVDARVLPAPRLKYHESDEIKYVILS
ncbi:hypothetical protein ACQ4PT_038792 [Festuca glaucescens]